MDQQPVSKNLKKLQALCKAVNSRYQRGLNDDDAVRKMFNFAESIADAQVIIGYDDYQALSIEEVNKHAEKATEFDKDGYFKIRIDHKSYRVKKP